MGERAGEQHPASGRQEHHAVVSQARDHQLDNLAEEFIPVPGGGDQRPGAHQEGQPFPCAVRLGTRGAGAGQQFGAFLLGPLPGGQVNDERRPAQRVAADHCRPDEDRHPVPVPVHVLLLKRLARSGPPQLLNGLVFSAGPLRRSYLPPRNAASLKVLPAVADDVEVCVVRLVDPVLADDHHAEHVGLPQPAQQGGALPQRRLGPPLLGQVIEDRVCPAGPAMLIPGIRDRGDPHPAPARRSVRA